MIIKLYHTKPNNKESLEFTSMKMAVRPYILAIRQTRYKQELMCQDLI